METLTHFSEVTSFVANVDKSNLFVVGVDHRNFRTILMIDWVPLGHLPMRYLGLLLSSKKWKRVDLQLLMKKIINRLKLVISYAGRIQIVTTALLSIHSL